jgi:hypothetical protein
VFDKKTVVAALWRCGAHLRMTQKLVYERRPCARARALAAGAGSMRGLGGEVLLIDNSSAWWSLAGQGG